MFLKHSKRVQIIIIIFTLAKMIVGELSICKIAERTIIVSINGIIQSEIIGFILKTLSAVHLVWTYLAVRRAILLVCKKKEKEKKERFFLFYQKKKFILLYK